MQGSVFSPNNFNSRITFSAGIQFPITQSIISSGTVQSSTSILEVLFPSGGTGVGNVSIVYLNSGSPNYFSIKDISGRATPLNPIIISGSGVLIDGSGTYFIDSPYQALTLYKGRDYNYGII